MLMFPELGKSVRLIGLTLFFYFNIYLGEKGFNSRG